MRKLTPILNLYFTANFFSESNKDGKIIGSSTNAVCKLVPFEKITSLVNSVNGKLVYEKHQLRLLLPFDFNNNTVNNTILDKFPDEFLFYIQVLDTEKFSYSGLSQKADADTILYLTPKNTTVDYQYNNRIVSAKPCSKANVIAAADYITNITADITRDQIQSLIQPSVGNDMIDLKILIENQTVILLKKDNLTKLQAKLKALINKKVSFSIKKNSDDSLIKDFGKVLITEKTLSKNTIGILSIAKSNIVKNETNYLKYFDINQFILHFPTIKTKLSITVDVSNSVNINVLTLDDKTPTLTSASHPQLFQSKQISCTINDYIFYITKPKTIIIQTQNQKNTVPINPILNYDAKKNNSTINITTNII